MSFTLLQLGWVQGGKERSGGPGERKIFPFAESHGINGVYAGTQGHREKGKFPSSP